MVLDLRQRRKELGYSVEELAEKADLSTGTIKNAEGKKHKPRRGTLKLIFDALKLDVSCDDYYLSLSRVEDNLEDEDNSDKNATNKLAEADKLFDEKKYEEALKIYSSLATIYEKGEYLYGCAAAYYMLGKYEEVLSYCEKLVDYPSYEFDALILQGKCLVKLSRRREAIEAFKKAVEIREEGEIYYNIGVCYYEENNLDSAINYYKKAIELCPNLTEAYLKIAKCYCEKSQYEIAIQYAKKVIEIDSCKYESYAILARSYRKLEKYEEALENCKKCLEINEESYQGLFGSYICLAILGNIEEAKLYSKKFLRVHGTKFFRTKKLQEGKIYICCTREFDDEGIRKYPTLKKVYGDSESYFRDVKSIREAVNVLPYLQKTTCFTEDYVKVNVVKLESLTLLQINFSDFTISDTNVDDSDLKTFEELYEDFKSLRIELEYRDEVFTMDCLNNQLSITRE